MKTLFFINANNCDVQIVEAICKTVVIVAVIVAVCYFLVQSVRLVFDWMKSLGIGTDSKEKERKYGLQKQDGAKALVKDFYEVTKDKEQKKDFNTTQKLLQLYQEVMSSNIKKTGDE